jgi:hypothetical protein
MIGLGLKVGEIGTLQVACNKFGVAKHSTAKIPLREIYFGEILPPEV